jgi:hypothetical protein
MTRNTSSMPIAIKPWYGSLCLVDDSCLRYIILRKIAVTFKLVQQSYFRNAPNDACLLKMCLS